MDKKTEQMLKQLGFDLNELEDAASKVQSTSRWEMTHKDVLDTDIIILGYHEIETSFGAAYLVRAIVEGEETRVLFGSGVLMKQLDEIWDGKPLKAKVGKVGRYYSFI